MGTCRSDLRLAACTAASSSPVHLAARYEAGRTTREKWRVMCLEKREGAPGTALACRDLEGNNISVIGKDDFRGMNKLRILHLMENEIHTVHRGAFADLTSMERLRLNNNKLRSLPDTLFVTMVNLQRLPWASAGDQSTVRPPVTSPRCRGVLYSQEPGMIIDGEYGNLLDRTTAPAK
ncbi:hypothetical protein HPB49_012984 [Dermacentor silvarum]|uniref:Uncharacterized protein n=1 Tax=Dermacentor silvarum TaxID=543639 RepID=A0ACB8E019_DERSI|nr:hypothetical protein HPB49_012984 [Dermacentor silvarum]